MSKTIPTFLLLFLFALPLSAKRNPVTIPFTTNSDGMVLLQATVAGFPVHLIFDTGAGIDVLAPSLIRKANGKPAGQFTGFRMTGERLDVSLYIVPELSVGPMVKKDALVGSWELLDQLHLDGIVSLNDFRQQPVTLEFGSKQLTFETDKSLKRRSAAGRTINLQFDDERGDSLNIFTQFVMASRSGQCEIDTGSPSSTISTRYMATLGIEKDAAGVHQRERPGVSGHPQVIYETQITQLALAAAPDISLAPAPVAFSEIIYDCVVGLDFWRGRALTIDIPRHRAIVANSGQS
jgi:hypothetical protein